MSLAIVCLKLYNRFTDSDAKHSAFGNVEFSSCVSFLTRDVKKITIQQFCSFL